MGVPPVFVWVGLVWLTLAVLVAKVCGVFGRRSIAGPIRIAYSESGWSLVVILFVGAAAYILLGGLTARLCRRRNVDTNLTLLIAGAVAEVAAFGLWAAMSAMSRPQGIERLGLKLRRLPRGVLMGLVTLFVLYPMVLVISEVTTVTLHRAGWPEPKPNAVLELVTASHQRFVVVLGVIMAVLIAPFFEELAFRGFLQTVLSDLFAWTLRPSDAVPETALPVSNGESIPDGVVLSYARKLPQRDPEVPPIARWTAVFITAICFALVHVELAFMPPLFLLAVGLGYLYERTGNLWATIATHSLFNGLQIFLALKFGMN